MDFKQMFDSKIRVSKETLDKEVLKFTLSLYNNALLSRKAVDFVIQQFNSFIDELFIPFLDNRMETQLQVFQNNELIQKVKFILYDNKNVFDKFSTEYRRFKIYEENSFYIAPELFEIGEDYVYDETELDQQNPEVKPKKIFAAHIPLAKTLQAVFTIPGLFQEMEDYATRISEEKTVLSNLIQGELWLKIIRTLKKKIPYSCVLR